MSKPETDTDKGAPRGVRCARPGATWSGWRDSAEVPCVCGAANACDQARAADLATGRKRAAMKDEPRMMQQRPDGGWESAIPEPLWVGWRLRKARCECGETFRGRLPYRIHWRQHHMAAAGDVS